MDRHEWLSRFKRQLSTHISWIHTETYSDRATTLFQTSKIRILQHLLGRWHKWSVDAFVKCISVNQYYTIEALVDCYFHLFSQIACIQLPLYEADLLYVPMFSNTVVKDGTTCVVFSFAYVLLSRLGEKQLSYYRIIVAKSWMVRSTTLFRVLSGLWMMMNGFRKNFTIFSEHNCKTAPAKNSEKVEKKGTLFFDLVQLSRTLRTGHLPETDNRHLPYLVYAMRNE